MSSGWFGNVGFQEFSGKIKLINPPNNWPGNCELGWPNKVTWGRI